MSQRVGQEHIQLWMVSRYGRAGWALFVGSLHEVVAHINRLHRERGVQHIAREVGQNVQPGTATRLPRLTAIALAIAAWLNAAEPWVVSVA